MKLGAFVAGLVVPVAVMAATPADADRACEPTKVQDWPICSPETMNAVSSPFMAQMPHLKAETFAREFDAPLPGRARMTLSGIVNGGGASCASHIASVIGDADVLRAPLAQRKQKRLEYVRKSLAGETVPHRVVFQIYTPNIEIQQSGVALDASSFRHDGIGGWRANSGGHLKIYLPETSPGELVAGESYPAFAQATGGELGRIGWLYTDWQGETRPVYYDGSPPPGCGAAKTAVQRMKADLMAETGDQPLSGTGNFDCQIKEIAFAGDKHYVTGQLEGRVVIDAVTNGNIAGHFELGGQAQRTDKRSRFEYDDRSGRLIGSRLANESETGDGLQVSGRFNAPNYVARRYTPGGQTVVVTGDHAPKEENLLHIRSHLPRLGQRNVDWAESGIRVKFDRPVDLGSLDADSFYLEYRDVDGQLQKVPVSYARPGPQTVRLMPVTELKDGVRYRVQIAAGRDGVRGQRGEPLDANYSWNFFTTVDLDDRESMPDLSDLVEPEEGVEAHVFQVSRDAALVADKPTMARVYVKWAEHDDVASNWQVRKFLASVRIHGDSPDGPVIGQQEKVVIQRPDEYSRDDERHAINTVNVYNLDIDTRPDTIFAEVRTKAKCDTPQRQFHSEALALNYSPLKATLNVTYYFIPVGKWADGVPEADRALAARIVASAGRFTTQNMPILGVNMRSGGDMALSEEWKQDVQDNAHKYPVDIRNKLMRKLEDRMSLPDVKRSDIIIGFMPYSLFPRGGHTYSHGLFDDDATGPITFPIPAVAMSVKPEVAGLGAVAHEFGHVFGLGHVPEANTADQRSRVCSHLPTVAGVGAVAPNVPIQGFRMAAGGHRGANKSVIEGNAESTRGLVPLMFPCMGGRKAPFNITKPVIFVTERNYETLLTNMARYQKQDLFTQRRAHIPLMLAANNVGDTTGPQSGRALAEVAAALRPPARGLLIAGHIGTKGAAGIDWTRQYTGHPRTPEDQGEWRLEALDSDGAAVAQQRFALETDEAQDAVFRVALDGAQEAHTIRLLRGDNEVATLARSRHAPQATITGVTQAEGSRVRIDWSSQDADGDELTHQLLYAPSLNDRWITLTGRDPGHRITVERALLAPGPQPTLKLIASDGFNETITTRPIKATAGLRVLAHGPSASSDDGIYAIFNTDLAANALTRDTFTLEDAAGRRIAVRPTYRAGDHTATLSPQEVLVPGTPYTVTLAASIADRYGHTLGEPVTWQVIRRAPSSGDPDTTSTDASNSRDTPASAADSQPSSADDGGMDKGWLEMAGKRRDFEIEKCEQTGNAHSRHELHIRGKAAEGLHVEVHLLKSADGLPRQQVSVVTGTGMYQHTLNQTEQGWETARGESADGPLFNIRNGRLTVDADLPVLFGAKGPQHFRIEAACSALASVDTGE